MKSKRVRIPGALAQRLAYYKADDGPGVLAPRGWHCFGTYGSNGSNLYVSPEPLDAQKLLLFDWKGFTGPAIQISESVGYTSGRFSVAKVIARVFPAHSQFVKDVIAEGLEFASSFPMGPYPGDMLTYRSKEMVEFRTPANSDGMGTASWLRKDARPIDGVAILHGQELSLTQAFVRLPDDYGDSARAIIQQVERETAH